MVANGLRATELPPEQTAGERPSGIAAITAMRHIQCGDELRPLRASRVSEEASVSWDWSLLVFVMLVVVAASSGVLFKPGAWYESLRKPRWTPPNWLFGPVWSVLYIMIAVAGWLVWRAAPDSPAMWLWGLQLVVNATWSGVFFGMRRMDLAFYDIGLLWILVAGFILTASGISGVAALLFVPYLVWVSIAGALNWTVWRMNPERV
jgi:benzodiazapine receptor